MCHKCHGPVADTQAGNRGVSPHATAFREPRKIICFSSLLCAYCKNFAKTLHCVLKYFYLIQAGFVQHRVKNYFKVFLQILYSVLRFNVRVSYSSLDKSRLRNQFLYIIRFYNRQTNKHTVKKAS